MCLSLPEPFNKCGQVNKVKDFASANISLKYGDKFKYKKNKWEMVAGVQTLPVVETCKDGLKNG